MRRLALGLALAIATGGSAAQAATLDFTFSFQNTAYGGGTVLGVVRGLAPSGTSSATSVAVTSNTLGVGLGEYSGAPLVNQFSVSNGAVQLFNFASLGENSQDPDTWCCSLFLEGFAGGETTAGFANNPGEAQVAFDTGIVFQPLATPGPAPVPLPAPALLLVAGLLALAGVRAVRRGATAA